MTLTPALPAWARSAASSSVRASEIPVLGAPDPFSRNSPVRLAPWAATTRVPSSGRAPRAQRAAVTPSRSSRATAPGPMYSEQGLSRGKRARSVRMTFTPARANHHAVALPAGPAPMTRTAASRVDSADTDVGDSVEDQAVRREVFEAPAECHAADVAAEHDADVIAVGEPGTGQGGRESPAFQH